MNLFFPPENKKTLIPLGSGFRNVVLDTILAPLDVIFAELLEMTDWDDFTL
jgi:hypothetical protein